jgi:hypothetical protein
LNIPACQITSARDPFTHVAQALPCRHFGSCCVEGGQGVRTISGSIGAGSMTRMTAVRSPRTTGMSLFIGRSVGPIGGINARTATRTISH